MVLTRRPPAVSSLPPIESIGRKRTLTPFTEKPQIVSRFQPSHNWTMDGGVDAGIGESANYTTDYFLSNQCIRRVTPGNNTIKTITQSGFNLDSTAKSVRIWVHCSNWHRSQSLVLFLSNDSGFANYYSWTVYGGGPLDESQTVYRSGEWIAITVDFASASTTGSPTRSGIGTIRIRMQDNNTGVSVAWMIGGLALVPNSSKYPNGVLSVTVDDHSPTMFTEFRRAMVPYGWSGTACLIAEAITDPVTSGRLSLSQARSMQDDFNWEIAGHCFHNQTHTGNGYPDLSLADADRDMRLLVQWMRANGFLGESFAWPFGRFTPALEVLAKRYFSAIRSTSAGRETLPPMNAWRLRQVPLDSSRTLAQVQLEVDRAQTNGGWLVLMGHVLGGSANSVTWTVSDFEALMTYVATKSIAVKPVGEVVKALAA